MDNLEQGNVVLSLSGHDFGRKYLIIKVECDRILCVDGKYRKINNPKQKSKKHLKLVLSQKFNFECENVLDAHVRKFLKDI